jgi:hypothetical protein
MTMTNEEFEKFEIERRLIDERLRTLNSEECKRLIGSLYERTHLSDAEYLRRFPYSPYCFRSIKEWVTWFDARPGSHTN